jgi:hypothetical protein
VTVDQRAEALAVFQPFLDALQAKPEVDGVVLLSGAAGAARNGFDQHSDIDMTVFVDVPYEPDDWRPDAREVLDRLQDRLPVWLPNFCFYVPITGRLVEVNVQQLVTGYELDDRTEWVEGRREGFANTSKVVYDPRGKVAEVMARQLTKDHHRSRLLFLLARLEWDAAYAPLTQAERGFVHAAHHLLNAALDQLVEVWFLGQGCYLPPRKWQLEELSRLGLVSPEERDLFGELLRVSAITYDEAVRRSAAAQRLLTLIRQRLPEDPGSAYAVYSAEVSGERQLARRTLADDVVAAVPELDADHVRNLVNWLLPSSWDQLATSLERPDIPEVWRPTAAALRSGVRGTGAPQRTDAGT